jgi:hypothetical protein
VFDEMQEQVVGIGMMHLRRKAFLEQWVPRPEPATQRAVAEYLDQSECGAETDKARIPAELKRAADVIGKVRGLIDQIEEARSLVGELTDMVPAIVRLGEALFPEPSRVS